MQYTGQILDGQMHGRGALIYPNGERYEGAWVYGRRHGCVSILRAGGHRGLPRRAAK